MPGPIIDSGDGLLSCFYMQMPNSTKYSKHSLKLCLKFQSYLSFILCSKNLLIAKPGYSYFLIAKFIFIKSFLSPRP